MAFKVGCIIMSPDADPKVHRTSLKTAKLELSVVLTKNGDIDQAVDVSKAMVESDGIQEFILCPGFTHEMVARIKKAVGDKASVSVARADAPSVGMVREILVKEGWLPGGH